MIYQSAVERRESQLTWFDRAGKPLGTLGAFDVGNSTPALSPDGLRVAVSRFSRSASGSHADIYILDGVRLTRLTFDEGSDASPIWSPDGDLGSRSARTGRVLSTCIRNDPTILAARNCFWTPRCTWCPPIGRMAGSCLRKTTIRRRYTTSGRCRLENGRAGTPTVFLNESHEERAAQFSPTGVGWPTRRTNRPARGLREPVSRARREVDRLNSGGSRATLAQGRQGAVPHLPGRRDDGLGD